jgi:hypothetical protein
MGHKSHSILSHFDLLQSMPRSLTSHPFKHFFEMSTSNLLGSNGQPAYTADNLTAICELENVKASTSHNLMGLHSLLQGQIYLFSRLRVYSQIMKFLTV